jgi:hypothetical protein
MINCWSEVLQVTSVGIRFDIVEVDRLLNCVQKLITFHKQSGPLSNVFGWMLAEYFIGSG